MFSDCGHRLGECVEIGALAKYVDALGLGEVRSSGIPHQVAHEGFLDLRRRWDAVIGLV